MSFWEAHPQQKLDKGVKSLIITVTVRKQWSCNVKMMIIDNDIDNDMGQTQNNVWNWKRTDSSSLF